MVYLVNHSVWPLYQNYETLEFPMEAKIFFHYSNSFLWLITGFLSSVKFWIENTTNEVGLRLINFINVILASQSRWVRISRVCSKTLLVSKLKLGFSLSETFIPSIKVSTGILRFFQRHSFRHSTGSDPCDRNLFYREHKNKFTISEYSRYQNS